ncbi:MAG: hypothetical protein R3C46_05480 [Hyphomonadaceae bacterium]
MRTLIILVLAGALAFGGFLTKPDEVAQRANAEKVMAERRGGFDVGDLIGDVLTGRKDERKFEDLIVATRYTIRSGDDVVLECLGLYAQYLCSPPEKK